MTVPSISPHELVTVFGSMQEGLQIVDREWRYVYLNAAAAQHGQRSAEELIGKTMMECYPGIETTPMFRALEGCLLDEVPIALENEFRYPDGPSRTFELRIAPCESGLTIMSIDVTERRSLENQFRQAQKMEAIGRLAGSIAHDFNNLLTVILGHAGVALMDLAPSEPVHADLTSIKWAGERASELTRQLLTMSRQQVVEPRIVDLNRLLGDAGSMLGRLIGEDVELSIHQGPAVPRVLADPGQLEQVLMNLVVNARDAMPDGGKLTIETAAVDINEVYSRSHFGVSPGHYAMLCVSDTGLGMDKETQAHIFEPFFTTKDVGKGTGLGLSTVFGIVRQCGGTVWVYSEPGEGTTFKVYLPETRRKRLRALTVTDPRTLEGTETVLLAEDQEEVRVITRNMLKHYGYHVIEARGANEAIALVSHSSEPVHLLLTDIVMPQMNGRELAKIVSAMRPEIKILYMSGYTDNTVIQRAILDPGTAYIQKPLSPEGLAKKVRQVLDESSVEHAGMAGQDGGR